MQASDRVLLIDVENTLRSAGRAVAFQREVAALQAAAGERLHHCVAAFALRPSVDRILVSLLAEVGVAPWPVPPGRDAAETALLAHARYVHGRGGRTFVVASGDHRFATLATLGKLEVVAWEGQQVAKSLVHAAKIVHRIPRPGRARG